MKKLDDLTKSIFLTIIAVAIGCYLFYYFSDNYTSITQNINIRENKITTIAFVGDNLVYFGMTEYVYEKIDSTKCAQYNKAKQKITIYNKFKNIKCK